MAADAAVKTRRDGKVRVATAWSLLVLSVVVIGMNVRRYVRPPSPPTAHQAESMARMETAVAGVLMQQFASEHRRWPDSPGEAGIALPGVDYIHIDDGFVLSAMGGPTPVTLRSDQAPEEVLRALPSEGSR